MKITIYSINNCNFCKQEKEYLTSNKLAFEEKNLEVNREFLAEMLKLSNNFAGVPFTMIEKDNGEVVPLKGFTKEEFDVVLGLGASVVDVVSPAATVEAPITEPVVEPTPVVPSASSGQVPEIKPMETLVVPPTPVVEVPIAQLVVEPVPVTAPEVKFTEPTPVVPEIKPMETLVVPPPVVPPSITEVPKVEPVVSPVVEVPPVVPPSPVADPNDELKKVIDSLGAMASEQKPVVNPTGMPSIPDFSANK